jgi:hypothetical protein
MDRRMSATTGQSRQPETEAFSGFSPRWKDFPDYILGITKDIWEGRAVASLDGSYAGDVIVRTPGGIVRGNGAVKDGTMATIHEFPDRQLYGEDVIWSGDAAGGYLSSHRLVTTGTHMADGHFGPATGRGFRIRVIADCAAKDDAIFDEWLVRDAGGIVRQLGMDPRNFARSLIEREGGPEACALPFSPDRDIQGRYVSRGNGNAWGGRYAGILGDIMSKAFDVIPREYDRACLLEYPGSVSGVSHGAADRFWLGLRSSFPSASFEVHHVIGREDPLMPPRAAVRWSLTGKHDGWGAFGAPTGAPVHVMGLSHAEFGPWGLRRECALYDEVAIWKQIHLHTGI